ncbi:MAG TPA: phospholipase domain-containing protein, partial [Flavitalea sp.]|nr:phospholipase domain-containing protein [Flavitalea sp.]
SHKAGKQIKEENISEWRRTVCGDLTSVFKPYNGEAVPVPESVKKNDHIELITNAKFKEGLSQFQPLSKAEIEQINNNPHASPLMPQQEKGIRPSRPLPYQLYADGKLSGDKKKIGISFSAANEIFRDKAAGAPFLVYATGVWKDDVSGIKPLAPDMRTWNYTVSAGDTLSDSWSLDDFDSIGSYHLQVYGPNGFYRELAGNASDHAVEISCEYQRGRLQKKQLTGNIQLILRNLDASNHTITITDNAYGGKAQKKTLGKAGAKDATAEIIIDLAKSFGWYDFTVKVAGNEILERRYAGHVETGKESFSDPVMGGVA